LIDEESIAVADLWARSRGGMGELHHLPFRGGMADQPAKLMDAFSVIARTVEMLKPKS